MGIQVLGPASQYAFLRPAAPVTANYAPPVAPPYGLPAPAPYGVPAPADSFQFSAAATDPFEAIRREAQARVGQPQAGPSPAVMAQIQALQQQVIALRQQLDALMRQPATPMVPTYPAAPPVAYQYPQPQVQPAPQPQVMPRPVQQAPQAPPTPQVQPQPQAQAPAARPIDLPGLQVGSRFTLAPGTKIKGYSIDGTARVNAYDGKTLDLTVDASAAMGFVKMTLGIKCVAQPDGTMRIDANELDASGQPKKSFFGNSVQIVSSKPGSIVLRDPKGQPGSLRMEQGGMIVLEHPEAGQIRLQPA